VALPEAWIISGGAKIAIVPKPRPLKSRRRLGTSVRKRITSYYTAEEQDEIASAAANLRVSISGFVANVALKEARRVNTQKSSARK
jgi:hypothetical protein